MPKTALQAAFAPAKRSFPVALWSPIRALATAVLTPLRFSRKTGHWKSSLRRSACDATGAPIPWYTFPAIDFLSQRDFSGRDVLEFGGGQSTLWWAKRARSVLTIEEDESWSAALRAQIGDNVTLRHVPVDVQTRSVKSVLAVLEANPVSRFDVIVVDGHLREELIALAFDFLAPGGAIIVDDAEGYDAQAILKSRDCSRIDFYGFAPGVVLRHCTSLALRGDCFLLKADVPIADLEIAASGPEQRA